MRIDKNLSLISLIKAFFQDEKNYKRNLEKLDEWIDVFSQKENLDEVFEDLIEISLHDENKLLDFFMKRADYYASMDGFHPERLAKIIYLLSFWGESSLLLKRRKNFEKITYYLGSLGNQENFSVRLVLMKYFSFLTLKTGDSQWFDRMISRFGFSLSEKLFEIFFESDEKNYQSYNFITEIFKAFNITKNKKSHMIFHEILKNHMMKYEDNFFYFLNHFIEDMFSLESDGRVFMDHLFLLLEVSVRMGHKKLIKNIGLALDPFRGYKEYGVRLEELLKDTHNFLNFRSYGQQMKISYLKNRPLKDLPLFKNFQRGRKSSYFKNKFTKDPWKNFVEIAFSEKVS